MLAVEPTYSGSVAASEAGWWAVYTRHQHEKVVASMLEAKGLEVFLPLYETVHKWKDRKKNLKLPLFPCYLFIRERVDGRLLAVTTPGMHMILTRGDGLAVISAAEIEAIRRALGDPTRIEPHPFLKCGERVRVIRGAMEGVEGILVRKKNLFRLILSVEMLSQSAAVEVEAADIEPVASYKTPYRYLGGNWEAAQQLSTTDTVIRPLDNKPESRLTDAHRLAAAAMQSDEPDEGRKF